ncbi:hypothetical protein SACS_0360 [Parasaccharibacter apium]|uniref:Purine nucleoside permease n=1 Tax=Parasaccharibacter apium TaxID=1510841 RepID=A0A7U7G4R5_9PROT|nr:purine nucleoside permease [Parasaccharibacter apium]CDG33098.1 hypothetical protein SACS_0360 [Parasaccharibacter apium]
MRQAVKAGWMYGLGLLVGLVAAGAGSARPAQAAPLEVHVVVVTTFELGQDSGDMPGEFQHWVEQYPLEQTLPAPGTEHGVLRYNAKDHVLGLVSGEGPGHMAAAITALALDPRFDLRHAYFVLAGIAGVNPNKGSIGSAAWALHVVNGGAAHLIDSREIPSDWPDGFTPLQGHVPDEQPRPPLHSIAGDMAYTLRPSLVRWAYERTRHIALPDNEKLQAHRRAYQGFPEALKPPHVMMGDTISGETYWLGALMNRWAERWVAYWTDHQGEMVTTAEEDIGLCQALALQARAGRVDDRRLLILRTTSNFDMPPNGVAPATMLANAAHEENLPGLYASTSAAYQVASPIVRELATHWGSYEGQVP